VQGISGILSKMFQAGNDFNQFLYSEQSFDLVLLCPVLTLPFEIYI
jgi:hypothetical protein